MGRAILLVAALTAAGCLNPNAPTDVRLATPFELAAGRTAELPDGLRLTFDRVSADSRCPMDALCVTAGDATVVLNVFRSGERPVPIVLHSAGNGSEIDFANHHITLTALAPYPRASQPILADQYVVTLVVTTR